MKTRKFRRTEYVKSTEKKRFAGKKGRTKKR
jgi:hypothetical protein